MVTKRLVYLKEFLNGLDAYGLRSIIQTHPEACKHFSVQCSIPHETVDANYLFSILSPEYAQEGSTRREVEESIMDFFQDFLFHLEDDLNASVTGYAETMASSDNTGTEPEESHDQILFPDLSPAGIMGWPTIQKHRPLTGKEVKITLQFDHDCFTRNPKH